MRKKGQRLQQAEKFCYENRKVPPLSWKLKRLWEHQKGEKRETKDLKRADCSIGYLIMMRFSWGIIAQDLQIQDVPWSAEGCRQCRRLHRSASGSRLYGVDCWLPCVACLATRIVYGCHWSGGYARHRNVRCINSALFWESRNTKRARPPAAPPDGES